MGVQGAIKLTLFVYRLTEAWDERSPVRFKVRQEAAESLRAYILLADTNPASQKAREAARAHLSEMGEALRWARKERMMSRQEFAFLRDSYEAVGDELKRTKKSQPQEKAQKSPRKTSRKSKPELKEREARIVSILRRAGRAQVSELKEEFPEISKRTLRRDLDGLLEKELIVRKGEWNDVYYTLSQS